MIRCLVADDARAFRAVMRHILSSAPGVEVVGEASDGREAVTLVRTLRPDVVTLDVRMPHLDGLAALEEIMRVAPTPVIVVSGERPGDAQQLSFRALQLGAIDVLAKPRDPGTPQFARQAEAIRQAVRAVAGLVLVGRRRSVPSRSPAAAAPAGARSAGRAPLDRAAAPPADLLPAAPPALIAIAASTGGPAALASILARLPRELPVPLLVAQHIAPGFELGFARWLATTTPLQTRIARHGEPLLPAVVYVAPEDRHLGVSRGRVELGEGPPIQGFRPSGTHLFSSVAREHGARAAGFVLSGMGSDGAAGLAQVRAAGGYTAAQSAASSVVFGMPRVALESGAAAHALDLEEIPRVILRLLRRDGARPPAGAPPERGRKG